MPDTSMLKAEGDNQANFNLNFDLGLPDTQAEQPRVNSIIDALPEEMMTQLAEAWRRGDSIEQMTLSLKGISNESDARHYAAALTILGFAEANYHGELEQKMISKTAEYIGWQVEAAAEDSVEPASVPLNSVIKDNEVNVDLSPDWGPTPRNLKITATLGGLLAAALLLGGCNPATPTPTETPEPATIEASPYIKESSTPPNTPVQGATAERVTPAPTTEIEAIEAQTQIMIDKFLSRAPETIFEPTPDNPDLFRENLPGKEPKVLPLGYFVEYNPVEQSGMKFDPVAIQGLLLGFNEDIPNNALIVYIGVEDSINGQRAVIPYYGGVLKKPDGFVRKVDYMSTRRAGTNWDPSGSVSFEAIPNIDIPEHLKSAIGKPVQLKVDLNFIITDLASMKADLGIGDEEANFIANYYQGNEAIIQWLKTGTGSIPEYPFSGGGDLSTLPTLHSIIVGNTSSK